MEKKTCLLIREGKATRGYWRQHIYPSHENYAQQIKLLHQCIQKPFPRACCCPARQVFEVAAALQETNTTNARTDIHEVS